MQANNEFDKKLELYKGHIPEATLDAMVWAVDTLDILWAGAQAVFGKSATPEHALRLLEIVDQRTKCDCDED